MARLPATERSRSVHEHRPQTPAPLALIAVASFWVASGIGVCSGPADGASVGSEIEFERHGAPVAALDLDRLRERVEPRTVRVHEPYEKRPMSFRALRLDDVLDAVYSRSWREEEELLFACRDGYRPTLPVSRVLSHRAWLAFAREGQASFTIEKLESGAVRTIEVGPYYLVWENLDDEQVMQESDYGWPYQLVGVDLIRHQDRFPKLVPPEGSSAQVRAGFAAFRVHCTKCHKLNGEGGDIGPELNPSGWSGEYYDQEWLRTWITEPSKIRPNARMPAINPALPERERTVEQIIAYLYAMVGVGADAAAE